MQNIAPDTLIDGRYRVTRRLGSGGMADVYCAEDTQLGRKVALKLLYRRFAEDEEFVERFRREASSAAGLQHPNVVSVYDRGEWDGTYYIAMEFLEGRSLKQLVAERGPLPPMEAADLIVQVLKAARFAHRRGIVHRDFKPHNVIVDAEGRAKVTDFGIARAGASDMTETGSIMGTAQYLSPEQAQGHAVSPQSDLYSIGIMLYELLTGRLPFDGESPVTVALKQVSEDPVPPSALNPAVPPALEGVVLHALQKDPARRFADADAFIAALAQAMGTEGHTAMAPVVGTGSYPVVGPEILEEEDRRNLRRIGLITLAVLLLAGLAAGAYLLTRPEKLTVPDVVRNKSVTASTRLQNAGFGVNIQRSRNATVPEDRVFRQDPAPGEQAEKGATVTLLVSDGPGDATIPPVAGLGEKAARRALERAGFKVDVTRAASDTVRRGHVVESSPSERSRLQRGQTVALTVSSGPDQVAVPGVTGRPREEAESALQAAGFEVKVTEQESESAEPGTVLTQSPASGAMVARGTAVALTVAKAPEKIAIPDVVGRSRAAASAALREAGFTPRVRFEDVDTPDDDGKVTDQSPGAGEERKRGATVFVTLGRFEPPKPDGTPTPTPTPDSGGATTP